MKNSKTIAGIMAAAMIAVQPMAVNAENIPNWSNTSLSGQLPEQRSRMEDDFYQYVNYDYLKEHQEKASSVLVDGASEVTDFVMDYIKNSEEDNHEMNQLRIFYEQAEDLEKRAELGTSQLQPYLDRIAEAENVEQLSKVLAADDFPFTTFLNISYGGMDMSQPARFTILPNFLLIDAVNDGASIYQEDARLLSTLFSLMNSPKWYSLMCVAKDMDGFSWSRLFNMIRLEKEYGQYASYQGLFNPEVTPRDEWHLIYESMPLEEAAALCPSYPLMEILKRDGWDAADTVSVPSSKWLKAFGEIWNDENLDTLKDMACIQILTECAPYLTPGIYLDETFLGDETETALKEGLFADEEEEDDEEETSDEMDDMDDFDLSELKEVFSALGITKEDILSFKVSDLMSTISSYSFGIPVDTVLNLVMPLDKMLEELDVTSMYKKQSAEMSALSAANQKDTFSHLLGKIYVEKALGEKACERITNMVNGLIVSYKKQIEDTSWLQEETKEKLKTKLDRMGLNILAPESGYMDFSDLNLVSSEDGGTLFDNYLLLKQYTLKKRTDLLGETAHPDFIWYVFSPLTMNCFYDTDTNAINIFPGFISSSMYQDSFSDEQLLGSLGFVTGHEISHGFDTVGSFYNEYGMPFSNMTEQEEQEFDQRSGRLADYYSTVELAEGGNLDGKQIITEAVADLSSIGVCNEYASNIDGFDYKVFYEQVAKDWADVEDPFTYLIAREIDTHPISYLRCNVNVQMYPTFYDTFDIQQEDGMYLPEDERIVIWG